MLPAFEFSLRVFIFLAEYTTAGQCNSQPERGNRYVWAVPYDATDVTKAECLVQAPPVDCKQADWSRYNIVFYRKIMREK